MKMDCERKVVSESRKVRKPLMEKKRRARINDSLETLKHILLESNSSLKESAGKKNGQRTAKLEKADILEMTVRYVQNLRNKLNQNIGGEKVAVKSNKDNSENVKMGVTLIPTTLNGEIVFMVPSCVKSNQEKDEFTENLSENVWRPW